MATNFTEIADRVWVARHEWLEVNVTVVAGETGLVVVDTLDAEHAAGALAPAVRSLSSAPLLAIVNTHAHYDHVQGNAVLVGELGAAPVVAHEETAAQGVHADRTFSSVLALDLGERQLELVHPGRGHTGGDLVARVGDADVLLAGDLVEESGAPSYGEDCHPLDWPLTLDLVLELIGPGTVVVPGHGARVGREFVQEQRSAIGVVAQNIEDLAGQGVPAGQALARAAWPYPQEDLADAVRRGYAQLPAAPRQLPLI